MKLKNYPILIALLFGVTMSYAQPTLTTSNQYTPGLTPTYYIIDTFNVGAAGTAVTWDFSSLTNDSSSTAQFLASSGAPFYASFPTSDVTVQQIALNTGDSTLTYYDNQSTGVFLSGAMIQSDTTWSVVSYTDSEMQIPFGISYGQTATDNVAGTITTWASIFDHAGDLQIDGDAYGTLILPTGTFHNVIRFKKTLHATDSYLGTEYFQYVGTSYFWMQPGQPMILLSYTKMETFLAGSPYSTQYSCSYSNALPVGIQEASPEFISLQLYPNPASDVLQVKYNNHILSSNVQINITNLKGQQVLHTAISDGSTLLDIQHLSAGTYFITLSDDQTTVHSKFVKQF